MTLQRFHRNPPVARADGRTDGDIRSGSALPLSNEHARLLLPFTLRCPAFREGDRGLLQREIGPADLARIAVTAPFLVGRLLAVQGAARIPLLDPYVDRYLIGLVQRRLATYGNPEYVTDAKTYTPVAA